MDNSATNIDKIAIVGMHCRFPGANDADELWNNLASSQCSIKSPPEERHEINEYANEWDIQAGFLDSIKKFDAEFFNISPNEAKIMDPQQRALLEVTWGAVENAGYTRASLDRNTGVFVGVISGDYGTYLEPLGLTGDYPYRGTDRYQLANRLSFFWDIYGPSLSVDTACSSSGAAVHLACESIRRKECPVAIASGVNLFIHPSRFIQFRQLGIISPDNVCHPFGNDANGTVYGEGICSLILKPLSAAENSGDNILGVILASAMNAGGRTQGFTVPNRNAQKAVVKQAIQNANIDARTISYIEAHGTATKVGDPIELRGLKEAFSDSTLDKETKQYCSIGSVKGNIGHLESAAAVAGIVKVLKQMQHKTLVPTLFGSETTKISKFEQTPFYLQKELTDWKRPVVSGDVVPRRAGVSSFGAGGANVHIILEEYCSIPKGISIEEIVPETDDKHIFVFSAQNQAALQSLLKKYVLFLDRYGDSQNDLRNLSYTLQLGRDEWSQRLGIIAKDKITLIKKIKNYLEEKKDPDTISDSVLEEISKEFKADGESKLAIDCLLENKVLRPLLTLWAKGASVDWSKLYKNDAHFIGLPTYPFDGDEYWLPRHTIVNIFQPGGNSSSINMGLPGLRVDTPGTGSVNYIANLSLAELPYLEHHRIFEQAVVPGSWYVALALTVARAEQPENKQWALEHCTFHETMQIDAETLRSISCVVAQNNNKCTLNIYSAEKNALPQSWTLHFSATVITVVGSDHDQITSKSILNLSEITNRCTSTLDVDEFYADGLRLGFSWTGPFKAVQHLKYVEGESIGLVKNEPLVGDTGSLVISAALLDACFQVYLSALPEEKRRDNEVFIPISVDRIDLYSAVSDDCYSIGEMVSGERDHAVVFNSKICSTSGKIALTLDGLSAYRISSENLTNQRNNNKSIYEDWCYKPEWLSMPMPDKSDTQPSVLIVAKDESMIFSGLLENWSTELAKPGSITTDKHDFENKLSTWINEDIQPAIIVVTLSANDSNFIGTVEHWDTEIRVNLDMLRSVFYQSNAANRKITIWVVSSQAQSIDGSQINPVLSGFWGLCRSLAYEYPQLWGGLVDIPEQPNALDYLCLIGCMSAKANEDQIAIRNGKAYALRLSKVEGVQSQFKTVEISENYQYVVSGGLGSIGQVHMRWLLERGAGHVTLVGRSAGDDTVLNSLANNYGDRVSYQSVDISVESEVRHLVASLESKNLPIKGVIHTVGVLADGVFDNSSWDSFAKVLSGKVYGAINILNALPLDHLDFVVFTSTATALLGSAGQSNYTMANAFLDGIAQKLKNESIPAVSVNWGPWKDTGMVTTMSEQAKQNAQITAGERGGISPDKVDYLFNRLYSAKLSQVAVLPDGWQSFATPIQSNKLMSTWKTGKPTFENISDVQLPVPTSDSIENTFRKIVADILGHSDEFDFSRSFQQLGFDSLTAVKLRNELNRSLSLSLPATALFDYPNPATLVEYIENTVAITVAVDTDTVAKAEQSSSESDFVAKLSDDEAERMLAIELEGLGE